MKSIEAFTVGDLILLSRTVKATNNTPECFIKKWRDIQIRKYNTPDSSKGNSHITFFASIEIHERKNLNNIIFHF